MVEKVISLCAVHYKLLKLLLIACVNNESITSNVLVCVAALIKVNLLQLESDDALG